MSYSKVQGSDWTAFMKTARDEILNSHADMTIIDEVDNADGYAFMVERDNDGFHWSYESGSSMRAGTGWKGKSATVGGYGDWDDRWASNSFYNSSYNDGQDVNYWYYSSSTNEYAWIFGTPINSGNGGSAFEPIFYGMSHVTKLWDFYPAYDWTQYAHLWGGDSSLFYQGGDWAAVHPAWNFSSPEDDDSVMALQTGGVTGGGEWAGSEKNFICSNGYSGSYNTRTPLGTIEGWGFDPQFNDRNHEEVVEISGTNKRFIYIKPHNNVTYHRCYFQYES